MQTSQAPVREALRELEAIGLIETQRNKGARVRIIDEGELAEIYSVRAELEALAGELVASRSPGTAKDLAKLLMAANEYPFIRQATTATRQRVLPYPRRGPLEYVNTTRLLRNSSWQIELSKTTIDVREKLVFISLISIVRVCRFQCRPF